MEHTVKERRSTSYFCPLKLRSGKPGPVWWVKYYVNGRPTRESTGMGKVAEAKRFVEQREGRVEVGQPTLSGGCA